jgi:hypothetical protein
LIVESDPEHKVNWATFAAYTQAYRQQVAQTKAINLEVKVESQCLQSARRPLLDLLVNIPAGIKLENVLMGYRRKVSGCKDLRLLKW